MRGFEILAMARALRHFTQREVVDSYDRNLSLTTYRRWEKGTVPISHDNLVGIVEGVLNFKVYKLMELSHEELKTD